MKNVTINSKNLFTLAQTPIKLNNGSIVIHYDRMGSVLGAYIVTSYRKGTCGDTANYCSLVDLDNGYIKFEERCSRNTTIVRVLSHLNPNDYEGREAVRNGQYIEVHPVGTYSLDITTSKKVGE